MAVPAMGKECAPARAFFFGGSTPFLFGPAKRNGPMRHGRQAAREARNARRKYLEKVNSAKVKRGSAFDTAYRLPCLSPPLYPCQ